MHTRIQAHLRLHAQIRTAIDLHSQISQMMNQQIEIEKLKYELAHRPTAATLNDSIFDANSTISSLNGVFFN